MTKIDTTYRTTDIPYSSKIVAEEVADKCLGYKYVAIGIEIKV